MLMYICFHFYDQLESSYLKDIKPWYSDDDSDDCILDSGALSEYTVGAEPVSNYVNCAR